MPIEKNNTPGIPLRLVFGYGDIEMVLLSPSREKPEDSIAFLSRGITRDIGAYGELEQRELRDADCCVAALTFDKVESLRVLIEELQALERKMCAQNLHAESA